MKKIPDIINRLWNVCGQMEVGALLTCGSGINRPYFSRPRKIPAIISRAYIGLASADVTAERDAWKRIATGKTGSKQR